MAFIEHTVNWVKGETFEAGMIGIYGTMLIVLAVYFWKFGNTPAARALVIPVLVVGLLWGLAGGGGTIRNKFRVESFRTEYKKDPDAFVKAEKKRVEGFMGWYRPLFIGWSVLMAIGVALFIFWGGNRGRAIGLAVILVAVGGLMVDHTSEQNAKAYHAEIKKAVES